MEEMLEDTLQMDEDEEIEEEADAEVDKVLFDLTNGKLGLAGSAGTELPVGHVLVLSSSILNFVADTTRSTGGRRSGEGNGRSPKTAERSIERLILCLYEVDITDTSGQLADNPLVVCILESNCISDKFNCAGRNLWISMKESIDINHNTKTTVETRIGMLERREAQTCRSKEQAMHYTLISSQKNGLGPRHLVDQHRMISWPPGFKIDLRL